MGNNKKKLLLFALESIKNVGDEMLRVTTEYIISSNDGGYVIAHSQLKPKFSQLPFFYKPFYLVGAFVRLFSGFFNNALKYRLLNISYILKYFFLFRDSIKKSDKIILPVGMLKYGTQEFSYVFSLITSLASSHHKPVLMSAMSPQCPEDEEDWRFRQLVKAVNSQCVTSITTRDGVDGVSVLNKFYIKNRMLDVDYVGDPALWIPDCYGLSSKKQRENKQPYVGINVIRTDIFEDYNKAHTSEHLYQFYVDLIKELDSRDCRWSLFTNGMALDNKIIERLKKDISISADCVLESPLHGDEYVKMVSKFDVVFGARLHACITSVSLGIPVVGFVWDDKIRYFAKSMGIEKLFFEPNEMSACRVADRLLEDAINFNFDFENRDSYKYKTKISILEFLQK